MFAGKEVKERFDGPFCGDMVVPKPLRVMFASTMLERFVISKHRPITLSDF